MFDVIMCLGAFCLHTKMFHAQISVSGEIKVLMSEYHWNTSDKIISEIT